MAARYIFPILQLPFVVDFKLTADRAILRMFARAAGEVPSEHILAPDTASTCLAAEPPWFYPFRATPPGVFFDATLLPGYWHGPSREGMLLTEVSQQAFIRDPDVLGKSWSDRAVWNLCVGTYDGVPRLPYNRTADTSLTKQYRGLINFERREKLIAALAVPFASYNLDQATAYLHFNPAMGICHNLADAVMVEEPGCLEHPGSTDCDELCGTPDPFPVLSLSGADVVTPGGTVNINLSMTWPDGSPVLDATPTVFLETVNGYLPYTRRVVGASPVSFPVMALGLKPGDAIKVKAGMGFYSGMAEKIVTVI